LAAANTVSADCGTRHGRPTPPLPAPSRAEPIPGDYANGQALTYPYSRDNPTEALQAKMLTKDGAHRIAVNIARLPELLGKAD
jgi:hypothetical protein